MVHAQPTSDPVIPRILLSHYRILHPPFEPEVCQPTAPEPVPSPPRPFVLLNFTAQPRFFTSLPTSSDDISACIAENLRKLENLADVVASGLSVSVATKFEFTRQIVNPIQLVRWNTLTEAQGEKLISWSTGAMEIPDFDFKYNRIEVQPGRRNLTKWTRRAQAMNVIWNVTEAVPQNAACLERNNENLMTLVNAVAGVEQMEARYNTKILSIERQTIRHLLDSTRLIKDNSKLMPKRSRQLWKIHALEKCFSRQCKLLGEYLSGCQLNLKVTYPLPVLPYDTNNEESLSDLGKAVQFTLNKLVPHMGIYPFD